MTPSMRNTSKSSKMLEPKHYIRDLRLSTQEGLTLGLPS